MTHVENLNSRRVAIVGRGRVGSALARAFTEAGLEVEGPLGRSPIVEAEGRSPSSRGERPTADVVLLCVPDSEILNAAALTDATFVGHVSGATPLGGLQFGLHPLQTVTGPDTSFVGCG